MRRVRAKKLRAWCILKDRLHMYKKIKRKWARSPKFRELYKQWEVSMGKVQATLMKD